MAVLTGIAGFSGTIKDGVAQNGGNVALAIQTAILKILGEGGFAYKTATIKNQSEIKAGSVTYALGEVLQAEDYGVTGGTFQGFNVPIVTVPINIRRWVGYEYEDFDYSRMGSFQEVISNIINSIAMSIENDLNAHFWDFLAKQFDPTNGALRSQNVVLPNLVEENATQEEIKENVYSLQRHFLKVNKTYNKYAMGIRKEELMIFLDTYADLNIRQIYSNQPNSLAERWVANDLVGVKLGTGIYYYVDKMIGSNIPAGTSFSKDKALDLTKFVGFIIHNEAVAMPFNLQKVAHTINPANANPRFICKYQFGLGLVRKDLIWAIYKTAPTTKK